MAAHTSAPLPPTYEETTGTNNSAPYPRPPPEEMALKGGAGPAAPPYGPYQPQPYGMQPGPATAMPPVPVQAVYIPGPLVFLDRPMQLCCPSCNKMVVSRISHNPGALAWLSCGGLALLGCWLGCCLIPFCVDAMLDVEHFCPCCNTYLGSYKRL